MKAHGALARRLGVEESTLRALGDYTRSDRFTEGEKAALAATVALTREPRALPAAVSEQLRTHFDQGQVVEIICTIGAFNYVTRLENALDSLGAGPGVEIAAEAW